MVYSQQQAALPLDCAVPFVTGQHNNQLYQLSFVRLRQREDN